jgi:hypothetical protein
MVKLADFEGYRLMKLQKVHSPTRLNEKISE